MTRVVRVVAVTYTSPVPRRSPLCGHPRRLRPPPRLPPSVRRHLLRLLCLHPGRLLFPSGHLRLRLRCPSCRLRLIRLPPLLPPLGFGL
eukprot:5322643-Prymnesium_polylepis.1